MLSMVKSTWMGHKRMGQIERITALLWVNNYCNKWYWEKIYF